jgi:putative transcriptional regulator
MDGSLQAKSPSTDQLDLQRNMIRCHLARMLGEAKLKISDVSRDTGINRGTLTRLYYETSERYDVDVLDQLCRYFGCKVGDLLEYVPGSQTETAAEGRKSA